MVIGVGGNGFLSVQDGGLVTSVGSTVGSSTSGGVTLSGTGARWLDSAQIQVGSATSLSSVSISRGGYVGSASANLGYMGTITIGDSDSTWSNTGSFYIGNIGNGRLAITNGGVLTSTDTFIGTYTVPTLGSAGTVQVTGAGSRISNSGQMVIGQYGNGTLSIANAAKVTTGSLAIQSKGQVNLDGGTLEVGSASITAGGVFNWVKGVLGITGTGGATVGTGLLGSTTTLATGQNLNVSNTLTVSSGKAVVLNGGELNAKATTLSGGTSPTAHREAETAKAHRG